MDAFISDGLTSHRISPSTQDLQREIRDVLSQIKEQQADSLSTSLSAQSTGGGTQKLIIPAGLAVAGTAQVCRSVLVVHTSDNTVYMNIGTVADADDWPIPKNIPIPVPIDNCSKLNFFGTAADTIRLLWRN